MLSFIDHKDIFQHIAVSYDKDNPGGIVMIIDNEKGLSDRVVVISPDDAKAIMHMIARNIRV